MSKIIKSRDIRSVATAPGLPVWPARVVPHEQVLLAEPAVVAGAAGAGTASGAGLALGAGVAEGAGLAPGMATATAVATEPNGIVPEPTPPVPQPEQMASHPPVVAADSDARAAANRIVAAAQDRAEHIIDEALAGADRLAEEARAAGFQAGREEGLAAAADEIEQLREQLEEQRAQLEAERQELQAERERLQAEAEMAAHKLRHEAVESAEQLIAATQGEVIELALAIAGRIVRREIERDEEALIGMLVGALQRVRGAGAVTVRVSPAGVAVLADVEEEIDRTALGLDTITVVADPALGPGDVVVETNQGTVDARVDEQLAALRRSLGEVLAHGEH